MDQNRIQAFLKAEWNCTLMNLEDVRNLLGATEVEIEEILFAVTGGLWQKVFSFEIKQYLSDIPSKSPVILELTPPMLFVMSQGWEIDSKYKVFRFYRKDQPSVRTSLRIALDIERASEDLFRMQNSDDESGLEELENESSVELVDNDSAVIEV